MNRKYFAQFHSAKVPKENMIFPEQSEKLTYIWPADTKSGKSLFLNQNRSFRQSCVKTKSGGKLQRKKWRSFPKTKFNFNSFSGMGW